MNSNRNLIVALIALWCYTRNCNINLANNTAILLILYALLSRGRFGRDFDDNFRTPNIFHAPRPTAFPSANQPYQTAPCCPLC